MKTIHSPSLSRYNFSGSLRTITFFCFWLLSITAPQLAAQSPVTHCGTSDATLFPKLENYFRNSARLTTARTAMGEMLVYRLAIDINYNTYLLYRKDKTQITKVVHEFVRSASEVFEKEINVRLVVSDLLIWENPEPYPLNTDTDYYNNVFDYWTKQRPGDRDCVVSMSVRNGWFYGGGRMCSSNFPAPDNTTLAVDLLCHELGHTLGSPHTHSCYWPGGPIDVCASVEMQSPECTAPFTDYVVGSLMSYCRSVLEFHPYCRNLMRDYAEGIVQQGDPYRLEGYTPVGSVRLRLSEIPQPDAAALPAFSWLSTFRTGDFRIQVSRDPGFSELAEDTLLHSAFYQPDYLPSGSYFARVRPENGAEKGEWSNQVSFTMPGVGTHHLPPVLIAPYIYPDGRVDATFRNIEHADAYEVEVFEPYSGNVVTRFDAAASGRPIQEISFYSLPTNNMIRLRVRYGQEWTRWSPYPKNLSMEWENKLVASTPLVNTSATPILSFQSQYGRIPIGLTQFLEIGRDENFQTIVFSDSARSNLMNQYQTNKYRFFPKLEENEHYFLRTRLRDTPGKYTGWRQYPLETARLDSRFTYLTNFPKFSNVNLYDSQNPLAVKFYKSGDRLYLYGNFSSGYYFTTDLVNWQERTTSSTRGKIPNYFSAFGATPDGTVWMLHPPKTIVKMKPDGTAEQTEMSRDLYLYNAQEASVTPDHGLFFVADAMGIAQVQNGNLRYFQDGTFPNYQARALSIDRERRVWALMEGGDVYIFSNGAWNFHSRFPYWEIAASFCFDQQGGTWLYGEFGLAKFDASGWQNIPALKAVPVRKAVFDDAGQLWMAVYSINREGFRDYALMKLKNDVLTSYTDGFNFLKEAFDIEYFHKKLLIMTTGGEVHAFDETQIQRFTPAPHYCHGDRIAVTVTSNSSFGKDNRFGLELVNVQTGESKTIATLVEGRDQLNAEIPAALPAGTYQLRTVATSPVLTSNESAPFQVHARIKPEISVEVIGTYKRLLTTTAVAGNSYQWLRNGEPIPGETGTQLEATQSGQYALSATNPGQCTVVSEMVELSLPEPQELTLLQNAPNPFITSTRIAFFLPAAQPVSLELHDMNGRKQLLIRETQFGPGWHEIPVYGGTLTAGVYVCRISTKDGERSVKVVKY
ncbi:hypothetical protein GCM10023091_16620 [Ravibacter arvi]|uniref:Peptidase M12B domain-containing protein n=1 Tax=Ravibacter arvi TaxID=2051041 RepID=A0ABP8LWL8_9BACT